jgi:hypothetical protein
MPNEKPTDAQLDEWERLAKLWRPSTRTHSLSRDEKSTNLFCDETYREAVPALIAEVRRLRRSEEAADKVLDCQECKLCRVDLFALQRILR